MLKQVKQKTGRPSFEITDDVLKRAEDLASRGLSLQQVAYCLGICYDTLNERKKEFPEFSDALKRGHANGISEVANTLFEKAKSGDMTAAIFYLKCRAGWNDKPQSDEENTSYPDVEIKFVKSEI